MSSCPLMKSRTESCEDLEVECSRQRELQRHQGAAKLLQACPTLCDPTDGSPPGSPVPGILQTRTLEWVAISFSNACKWKVKVKSLSRARLLMTPWTAAYQAPASMGFSRQEYWSGLPLPSLSIYYYHQLLWLCWLCHFVIFSLFIWENFIYNYV